MDMTAWNNGRHHATGAGYGFKISTKDRDAIFKKSWKTVFISLPGLPQEVEVNIAKPSFWGATCRELISREFGRWLIWELEAARKCLAEVQIRASAEIGYRKPRRRQAGW